MRHCFINTPGSYILNKGLPDFHANTLEGILHTGPEAAVAVLEEEDRTKPGKRTHAGRNAGGFYIFPAHDSSPGHPSWRYQPKQDGALALLEKR